ncbi:MAG: diaminopimelate epimerase [Bacteroidota bacterium]
MLASPPPLVVEFTKMHGAGNDFVVLDNRFFYFSPAELHDLALFLTPRHTGVGADGLLVLDPPQDPDAADFRMTYLNADGSVGSMCGNGARCLARYARQAGFDRDVLRLETGAGPYIALTPADPEAPVRLLVPPPERFEDQPTLEAPPTALAGLPAFIWTGTEHLVCPVDDLAATPVDALGARLRQDAALEPAGANVNFAVVLETGGPDREAVVAVRTYEKGVEAETRACGTGALATAMALRLRGTLHAVRTQVQMPGGTLVVGFDPTDPAPERQYLEGPAVTVFRGSFPWRPGAR